MKNIFQSISGLEFRTEEAAREYYGDRFEGALASNILFKFVINKKGDVVATW